MADTLTWPSDLGRCTITGRFWVGRPDAADTDRDPDLTAATGTVTMTPSKEAVRYAGSQGSALITLKGITGVLDSQGRLCTPDAAGKPGPLGLIVPASDATVTPTGWYYTATITLDDGYTESVRIAAPTGATVDLVTAIPVAASGGTAIVVDTDTADRAKAAATSAEQTLAQMDARLTTATQAATTAATANLDQRIKTATDSALAAKATVSTATAALAGGASAGTVTIVRSGPVVVADLAGVVLTGTSEQITTHPAATAPPRVAGMGFVTTSAGEWWPVRATTAGIEVLGPAPAGTTIDGTLTWRTTQ